MLGHCIHCPSSPGVLWMSFRRPNPHASFVYASASLTSWPFVALCRCACILPACEASCFYCLLTASDKCMGYAPLAACWTWPDSAPTMPVFLAHPLMYVVSSYSTAGPIHVWGMNSQQLQLVSDLDALAESMPEILPHPGLDAERRMPDHVPLPVHPSVCNGLIAADWIGVVVHAAHYTPHCFGMRLKPQQGLVSLICQARRAELAVRPHHQHVVPISPQRFAGSASLLAYSTDLADRGFVAVIADLSRVGGHYYACNIPFDCNASDFLQSVQTELDCDLDEVRVLVGRHFREQGLHEPLSASSGDVITVLRTGVLPPASISIDELFQVGEPWDLLQDVPVSQPSSCVAVWFRGSLHTFSPVYHPDHDVLAAFAAKHHISVDSLRIQVTTDISNLCCQGYPCHSLAVLSEVPDVNRDEAITGTSNDDSPKPVICDLRPLGLPPKVAWPQADHLDPPALFAAIGFQPPASGRSTDVGLSPTLAPGTEPFRAGNTGSQRLAAQAKALPARGFSASDSEASDNTDAGQVISSQALVLALDYVGKLVDFEIRAPATLQEFVDAVDEELPHSFRLRYPNLVEVVPQLSSQWATLLALPQWTMREPIVVLDLSRIDGRVFPVLFPAEAGFLDICRLAQVTHDGSFHIFAYGSNVPVGEHEVVPVIAHGSICFLPLAEAPPAPTNLRVMLTSELGWDADPDIPLGPGGPRGNYICAILAEGHRLYALKPHSGQNYLDDISAEYNIPIHWTTARAAHPRALDICVRGFRCRGAALISADFANVPVPPGISNPGDFVIALDCRAIFQGWQQYRVRNYQCLHSDLTVEYEVFAPAGFQVQIDGAALEDDNLIVQAGQTLVLHWVPCSTDLEEASPMSHDPGADMHETPSAPSSDPAVQGSLPSTPTHTRHHHALTRPEGRSRSRSPSRPSACHVLATALVMNSPTSSAAWSVDSSFSLADDAHLVLLPGVRVTAAAAVLCMTALIIWALLCSPAGDNILRVLAYYAHFSPDDASRLAPWAKRARCSDGHRMLSLCRLPVSNRRRWRSSRLLVEPPVSSTREQDVFDELRHLANDIGQAWPYMRSIDFHGPPPDAAGAGLDSMAQPLIEMHFAIMVPDFQPERIWIRARPPLDMESTLILLQTQRDPVQAARFPFLMPAVPQPCPSWGLLIAAPVWGRRHAIVVFDLMRVDGRIFAISVPAAMRCRGLLQLAQLPPGLAVHVLIGFDAVPVPPERGLHLLQGQCITFVPTHTMSGPVATFDTLLLARDGWAPGPAYPTSTQADCYGIATEAATHLLVVDPNRPRRFYIDVADQSGIPAADCVVVLARPPVRDCLTFGFDCCNVLAAVRQTPDVDRSFCIIIVDCRAILRGWLAWRAPASILQIAALEGHLEALAPPSWYLVVSGPRPLSGRRAVSEGEVVVVECLQEPPTPVLARTTVDGTSANGEVAAPPTAPTPSPSASYAAHVQGLATPRNHPDVPRSSGLRWTQVSRSKLHPLLWQIPGRLARGGLLVTALALLLACCLVQPAAAAPASWSGEPQDEAGRLPPVAALAGLVCGTSTLAASASRQYISP